MLSALHRPFDAPAEHRFLATERVRTRRLVRIGAIAVCAIITVNWLLGVLLFDSYKGWVTCLVGAVCVVAMIGIVGSPAYLRRPGFDLGVAALMWVVLLTDFFEEGFANGVFRHYPAFAPADAARIFNTCTIQLFIISVYSSIVFLGNFRNYLLYTAVSTLLYELFVYYLLGFEPALKILFLSFLVMAISVFFNREREVSYRDQFTANALLDQERIKTEHLLFNVLPETVAGRLKSGDTVVDAYRTLTVVFVDVVGFSVLSKRVTPEALLDLLNRFFLAADHCADRHGMEKVKTIGDAYLAVAGGVSSAAAGPAAAIRFGIDLIEAVAALDRGVDIRVGINTGPAIGGVIGETRLAYDYWGETVNIAARIEGAAPVGGVAVSAATHRHVADAFAFAPPATIALKGVGDTVVYPLRRG